MVIRPVFSTGLHGNLHEWWLWLPCITFVWVPKSFICHVQIPHSLFCRHWVAFFTVVNTHSEKARLGRCNLALSRFCTRFAPCRHSMRKVGRCCWSEYRFLRFHPSPRIDDGELSPIWAFWCAWCYFIKWLITGFYIPSLDASFLWRRWPVVGMLGGFFV